MTAFSNAGISARGGTWGKASRVLVDDVVNDHDRFRRRDRMRVLNGGIVVRRASGSDRLPPDGARGVVRGFSLSSRRRLRMRLMGIAWDRLDTFWITLTYHNEWGAGWRDWKRDLRAFQKRLDRAYPGHVGDIWRLEFQDRGAPHFHIMVSFAAGCGIDRVGFRSWVRLAWLGVIGALDDRAAGRYGVRVVSADRGIKGRALGRLLKYIVKDVAKVGQADGVNKVTGEIMDTGRCWGVRGDLPIASECEIEFATDADYTKFLRQLMAVGAESKGWYVAALSPLWEGFALLGDGHHYARALEGVHYCIVEGDKSLLAAV